MDPFFFLGRRLILRELWQYLGTSRAICAINDIHQHRPWEAAQQISPALFPVLSLAFPLAALDRYERTYHWGSITSSCQTTQSYSSSCPQRILLQRHRLLGTSFRELLGCILGRDPARSCYCHILDSTLQSSSRAKMRIVEFPSIRDFCVQFRCILGRDSRGYRESHVALDGMRISALSAVEGFHPLLSAMLVI